MNKGMIRHHATIAEGTESLRDHIIAKASDARNEYGDHLSFKGIQKLLNDRRFVRYPVLIRFDKSHLKNGEFAYPHQLGSTPQNGYILYIHPYFRTKQQNLPNIIAYYLPSINYGDIVTYTDAELFGATLLGLDVDGYYQALCQLADAIS